MKKLIATLFAAAAGVYLLTLGILPDPVPFIDEGIALTILVSSLSVLGLDVKRFLGRGGNKSKKDQPIDIN